MNDKIEELRNRNGSLTFEEIMEILEEELEAMQREEDEYEDYRSLNFNDDATDEDYR